MFREPRKERDFETEPRRFAPYSREFQIDPGVHRFSINLESTWKSSGPGSKFQTEDTNIRRFRTKCGSHGDLAIGIFAPLDRPAVIFGFNPHVKTKFKTQ